MNLPGNPFALLLFGVIILYAKAKDGIRKLRRKRKR